MIDEFILVTQVNFNKGKEEGGQKPFKRDVKQDVKSRQEKKPTEQKAVESKKVEEKKAPPPIREWDRDKMRQSRSPEPDRNRQQRRSSPSEDREKRQHRGRSRDQSRERGRRDKVKGE